MSLAELRRKYDDFYTPRFDVTVGDETIRESDGMISEVTVDTIVDGADYFSVTLEGAYDAEGREFTGTDLGELETGTEVRIRMGYGDNREPMFVGRIQSVRPDFPSDGDPAVEVSGFDLLHDTTEGTRSRSWDETTDGDVVRDVAEAYAFDRVEAEATGTTRRKVIQENRSDYRFLRDLADRNGFELFADRGTLYFRKPKDDRSPAVTLQYGDSLVAFSPERNEADQVRTVEVRHWDPGRKREIVGTAERDAGSGTRVLRQPVDSREEAEEIAQSTLDRLSQGMVRGVGDSIGLPELRAGTTLRLEGLGEMFTGTYYVRQATHRIGNAGYETTMEATERVE